MHHVVELQLILRGDTADVKRVILQERMSATEVMRIHPVCTDYENKARALRVEDQPTVK